MTEHDDPDLIEEEDDGYVDDGSADLIDEKSALMDLEVLASRVRRLVELREERDSTATKAANAKKAFEEFQAEFFAEYERSPLKKGITVDLGEEYGDVHISPRKTNYGRIIDRDKAVAYFKERNKLDEYVKEDFQMKRLHELVRGHIEKKMPLPEGTDFYTKQYFTITFKD